MYCRQPAEALERWWRYLLEVMCWSVSAVDGFKGIKIWKSATTERKASHITPHYTGCPLSLWHVKCQNLLKLYDPSQVFCNYLVPLYLKHNLAL